MTKPTKKKMPTTRKTRDSDSPETEKMVNYTPLSYQPLSTHYIETARKNLAKLSEAISTGDEPPEDWYGSVTDALMLIMGTGLDAARITWKPSGIAEMRKQIEAILREQAVVAPIGTQAA